MKKILSLILASGLLLPISGVSLASTVLVGFDDLNQGDLVNNQYAGYSILFGDSFSPTANPAGPVVGQGFDLSANALAPTNFETGIFLTFQQDVFSFSAEIFEVPMQPPGGDGRQVVVQFDFEGTEEGELSVNEGETVTVLEDHGEWLLVRNAAGDTGYIPTSYVSASVYLKAFALDVDALVDLFPTDEMVVHSVGFWSTLGVSSQTPIAGIQLYGTQNFKIDRIVLETTATDISLPNTILLFVLGLLGVLLAQFGSGNSGGSLLNYGITSVDPGSVRIKVTEGFYFNPSVTISRVFNKQDFYNLILKA